jgi:hypothetical protein
MSIELLATTFRSGPNQNVGLVIRRLGRTKSLLGFFSAVARAVRARRPAGNREQKVTRLKSNLKSNRAAFKWRDAKIGRSAGTNNFVVLCARSFP